MVVIAGEARLVTFGRRDARTEVDRLYRKHSDDVLRYATAVLRSRPDAEDVVQATFMRALRSIRGGERVQKPRNWLIKIAHNECRRVLSVRSRRAEVELNDIATEPAEPGKAEELRRALGQLAPKQREALVLRELEGRSYAEIAESLDLTGSAVETLIFRARRAVREQLETALTCEEAIELITADAAADQDRERLRAHTRACAECATLERQARGRKGALRRLASSLGFPWFGKVAAVALTVSAAATTTGMLLDQPPKPKPVPHVRQPAVTRVGVQPASALSTQRAASSPAHHRAARPANHAPVVQAKAAARHTPAHGGASAPTAGAAASSTPPAAPTPSEASPEPTAAPTGPVSTPKVNAAPTIATPLPTDPVGTVLAPVQAVTEPLVAPVEPVVTAVQPVVNTVTEPLAPVTQAVTSAVSTVTTPLPVAAPVVPALTGPGGLLGKK